MNRSFSRLISCFIVILLFSWGLIRLSFLVERKSSYVKHAQFFQQKAEFDVLFLGTSHMRNSLYPMELWKDYGIISYNFAGPATLIPTNYWILRNLLDYTKPKIVVVDAYTLSMNLKTSPNVSYCHDSFDFIPFSVNRLRAILDLFDDFKSRLEFIIPFYVFHNRFVSQTISKVDFNPISNKEKGAISTYVNVENINNFVEVPQKEFFKEDSIGIKYINKILELCAINDISVVFTYIPSMEKINVLESRRAFDILKKKNVDYVGMELLREVVDRTTDFYDLGHLNSSGGRKITKFLGQYLSNHYSIPDRRNDPRYSSWHKDYQEYMQFKIGMIKGQKSLKNALMLLSDRNFSYAVYFPNDRLYNNKIIMKLLCNTGADVKQIYFQSPKVIIVDNKKKSVSYRMENENVGSAFGVLSVKNVKDARSFTLNGKELIKIKNGELLEAAILVFDNETEKQVIANKYYAL